VTELLQETDDVLSLFRTFAADEELAKLEIRLERRNGYIWDRHVNAAIPKWRIKILLVGADGTEAFNRIQRLAKTRRVKVELTSAGMVEIVVP
jgi:hypothetical protein